MQKLNKVLATGAVVAGIACMTVTAFAATRITFKVNSVTVTGRLAYLDSVDTDPFDRDSVTARTTSPSAMDSIAATANIYYAEGSTLKSTAESDVKYSTNECSVTAKESLIGVGYKGEGKHKASHGQKSNSGDTVVSW